MGKTYRKTNPIFSTSESLFGHSRTFAERIKRNTHHKMRKINDSTDWLNSEKALPCTKYRKTNILKTSNCIHHHNEIAPHIKELSIEDVLKPFAHSYSGKISGNETYIPHWCNENMNNEKRFNRIVNRKDLSSKNRSIANICKKQLERRGKIGSFRGHFHEKDLTLPPYDIL